MKKGSKQVGLDMKPVKDSNVANLGFLGKNLEDNR